MIILPERNIPVGKVLMPQHAREWRHSSQRKSIFGIEDKLVFRLTARLDDGAVIWRGWWQDRDEADDFLHALGWHLATRAQIPLHVARSPNPEWSPELTEHNVRYQFECLHFLTDCPGSWQEFIVPSDWRNPLQAATQTVPITSPLDVNTNWWTPVGWNNSNNSVECIGGGASGGIASGGGGGGGYAKKSNITMTQGLNGGFVVGSRGTGPGSDAQQSAFADTSPTTVCSALGGRSSGTGSGTGGIGGHGVYGDFGYTGGAGGSMVYIPVGGGGGGGAAGPYGNGAAGGGQQNVHGGGGGGGGGGGTAGGPGDNGNGGYGGANWLAQGGTAGGQNPIYPGCGGGGGNYTSVGAGSNGNEWIIPAVGTYGAGGGGGGGADLDYGGGAGGYYGAGGGGGGYNAGSGPGQVGTQGVIIVTYTPVSRLGLNMPMMGI